MRNEWMQEPGSRKLAGYVGAFGAQTSDLKTPGDLIEVAARMFAVERHPTCELMASAINALGRKERSARAKRYMRNMGTAAAVPVATSARAGALDAMMAQSQPRMIDGAPFGVDGDLDIDPAKLLRKVVSAVISAGHASDLYEFPDVLAFFNARMPDGGTHPPSL